MIVRFANRKLLRCYEDDRLAARTWGADVGRRYVDRINRLVVSATLGEIEGAAALRPHPLTGDRSGRWAMTLIGRWRLEFVPSDDMREALIVGVSMHYGD